MAISTDEVRIIGIGGYSEDEDDTDYSGAEDDSFNNPRHRNPDNFSQPTPPPPGIDNITLRAFSSFGYSFEIRLSKLSPNIFMKKTF